MREELDEASVQKKKMEEEHSTEKLELQQVRGHKTQGFVHLPFFVDRQVV